MVVVGTGTFLDESVIVPLPAIVCINEPAYGLLITAKTMPGTGRFGVCMCITIKFIRDLFKVCLPHCGSVVPEDLQASIEGSIEDGVIDIDPGRWLR